MPRSAARRLRDWWKGGDSATSKRPRRTGLAKEEVKTWAGRGASEPDWRALSQWTPGRLTAAEIFWGKGRIRPESPAFAKLLVAPFELDRVTSACDLNCGPYGVSPEIAALLPLSPAAYSRHEELVALSRHFALGEGRPATQRLHVPAVPSIEPPAVSALLAFDLVQAYVDKALILEALRAGLTPGGQFVFTDFASNASDPSQNALTEWRQVEPELFFDAPSEHWRMCREQGLEVEDMTDITEAYADLILSFMPSIKEQLYSVKRESRAVQQLRYEFELYARRLQAFESGAARLLRFYGQAIEI